MITYEDIQEFMEEKEALEKPPLTVPQMVEIFAETMRQVTDPEMSWALIAEEYQEVLDAKYTYDQLKELADLVYVIYGYARSRGWDLDEALRRVHKNNMERCVWPDGSVKRREDGKILKRPDATKIDLSDLV